MYRTITRITFLLIIILLLYRLTPTMPSSAALDASATPTVRPSATIPATRTSVMEQTSTASPTSQAQATHTVQPTGTLRPTRTATPSATATVTPTATFTPTATPSNTPTPSGPYAWPDTGQDWAVFSPIAPIVLHFTVPIDPASTGEEPALLAFPWIEGTSTWSEDSMSLTFQPDAPLQNGQSYHLYLNPKLKTANGEVLTGVTDWVLVAGSGPQVIEHTPKNVMLLNRYLYTSLTFDRPMDTASVAAALSVQPALPLDLTWLENTLMITCTEVLTPGLQLAFTLAGDAVDATGVPMGDDYAWIAATKPFTMRMTPYFQNKVLTNISITFSHSMDQASVEASISFSPPVTGTFSWNGDTQLLIKPVNDFSLWMDHQVVFSDTLQDKDSAVLPIPLVDPYIPPFPIQAASDWDSITYYLDDANSPLQIVFLLPVDQASVEAAVQIDPALEGSFSWDKNTLSFQPAEPLLYGSKYSLTIGQDAKASNGQSLFAAPVQLTFYADTWWGAPGFGAWGANIQAVDVNGTRAIQFQSASGSTYEFSLYQFDLPTFLEKYQAYFAWRAWTYGEIPVIPSEGAELAAQWTWNSAEMDERAVIPEVYLPKDVERGLYLLNMSQPGGGLLGQLFVVLTDNNLVVKWAGDELLTWVSDINGVSVSDIEVRLYSTKGEQIRTGQTDADGIYRTTVPEGYQPMLMVARTAENDFAITGLDGAWGDYSYSWWQGASTHPIPRLYQAYSYTDRPIYRPGQTVYFKTIIRNEKDVKYTLPPSGTSVTIRVRDGRDNIVQTFELATNEYGSVNGEFQLADGAMTGLYSIEAVLDEIGFRQDFKVEDYRKPEIQVSIAADAEQYVAGDPLTITVQADYFFGEPVANAKVTLRQYRVDRSYCWWGVDCSKLDEWVWYSDRATVRFSGTTDVNGQILIPGVADYERQDYYWYDYYSDDNWYGNVRSRTWGLEVTVEDGSGQAVSGYTMIKVYNVAEKLKLDIGRGLKSTGKPFSVTASAVTIAGEPVSGQALTLGMYEWNNNTRKYDSVVITPTELTTDADGLAALMITPPHNGYYKLALAGTDPRGQALTYNRYVYAYSPGDTWATRYSRSELKISLNTEQETIKPYDTVQLLIESTFAGPAMLTFERGRVNRVKPITLTPPLTIVDVEIIPEDAPNIFVTVNAWQPVERYPLEGEDTENWYWQATLSDSALRRSSVELTVDASDKALNVAIASDQTIYTPRQTATFTMTVTNAQGLPVEAELSLALVDEAIYSLSEELVLPIFEHFFGPRAKSVYTYNSMDPYRILHEAERGGGGGGGEFGLSPRSDFPDTAIWLPTITTDKNGIATVTVTLPDNLTSWRVVVRAVTKSTLVGEATYNITTHQPVVIRPQLPRSLTVGDQVILSAFVHNYTDGPLDLFASIQFSDASLQISGTALIPVSLAGGEVKLVEWQAHVLASGAPQVTFAAFQMPVVQNGRVAWTVGDAVQLPLSIQELASPEIVVETGTFSDEYNTLISLPPDVLGQSTVRLELSRSVAGSLIEGLEYLTGYPYGCVEQTMSRALPNAVVGRAFEKLAVGDTARRQNLEPLIRASVQRLYGYQHNDGGWGWWYDDATHDYQTAWVVFGLAVTAEAGYEVDPQVIQRGADWLKEHLAEMDVRTRAYALYSMAVAGHGDLAAVETLHAESLFELDPFSQAALALAYHKLGAAESAQAVLAVLTASATQGDDLVYWRQSFSDGYYDNKTMASSTRSTALALDALVQIDPQSDLIPGTVAWLMNQRRPYGWGTTNETAYAIIALTDHLVSVQERLGAADLQIEVNGSVMLTVTLAIQQPGLSVDIPLAQLQTGINHLSVKQVSGEGEVYYRLAQRFYLPQTLIPAAGPVSIQREYLDPKTKQPVANISAGDLVLVRLTVNLPMDGYYMILEDHLPGGLEAVNAGLNNTSHEMGFNQDYQYTDIFFWEDYGYNNKEIRADRVSFFITEMGKGKHVYTYLARATRPGDFAALPADVYAMYNETLWGRSASGRIVILPE